MTRRVEGTLTDAAGTPLAGWRLEFRAIQSTPATVALGSIYTVTLDTSGGYDIELLDGRYLVILRPRSANIAYSELGLIQVTAGPAIDLLTLIGAPGIDQSDVQHLIDEALAYIAQAEDARDAAQLAQSGAEGWSDLARDWATKTDGEVAPGAGYSAKHHAAAAASSALAASGSASAASGSALAASGSAHQAAGSALAATSVAEALGDLESALSQASSSAELAVESAIAAEEFSDAAQYSSSEAQSFAESAGVAGLAAVANTRSTATIAFVFDDGYRSNYLHALPLFKKYGFAATLAHEIERTGQNYGGNPLTPVCTAEDLRELIRAGWEVCNHPDLSLAASEAEMVAAAKAENELLRQLLTGEKVKDYSTGVITDGALAYPEFSDYRVTSAVYRGGARNDTSDRAYRYLFDKVRSINGAVAERGDHLFAFGSGAEQTTQMSAWPADTTSQPLAKSLAFIESLAQTRSSAILYAHDTSVSAIEPGPPYILAADLEVLLRRCHELGVSVIPLRKLFAGNAILDTRFDGSSGNPSSAAGDTVQFSSVDTLNGADRCVEITATGYRQNASTGYTTESFICEPFCRYRIRVRYKIDVDLNLLGGAGNRNHGLNVELTTLQANTSGSAAGVHRANEDILNDQAAVARTPYQATSGYAEYSVVLVTGNGAQAQIRVALFNAIGTVRIGQVIAEKLDSIIDRPLSGTRNFDTTIGRLIYLPSPNTSNGRRWEWDLTVAYNRPEPSATYTYAYNDSASIASPTNGQTCYVLGAGAGAFAGQGGKLATYNGTSWSFSTIANGTFFRVTTAEGLSNRWFRHRGIKSDGTPSYEVFYSAITNDQAVVSRVNSWSFRVFESSGLRSDAFTWIARPRAA